MHYIGPLISIALALHACTDSDDAATAADVAESDGLDTESDGLDTDEDLGPETSEVEPEVREDTSEPVDPDTGDVTPAEAYEALKAAWCPGYAARYCKAAEACGCGAAPGFPDAAACASSFAAQCGDQLAAYQDAVLSGQAEFLLSGVESCLATIEALGVSCVKLPGDTFFIDCPILAPPGGLPPLPIAGEPCAAEGRCAAGLRCAADGTCALRVAEGGACAIDPDCAPPLRCDFESCVIPDTSKDGEGCDPSGDCGDLVCTASAKKFCIAIVAGAPCQSDEDCLSVEYCNAGTCSPLPSSGAACGNSVACAAGLGCSLDTALCGALPGAGAPCALGVNGPLLCAEGTSCRDGLCGAVPGNGEPCAMGTPACGPGLGCAFESDGSFCRVPAPEGAPCQNDPTCAAGLYCEFSENSCRPHKDDGMACNDGNECGADGACLPDATFTFRCAPAPTEGEPCFLFDCAPGLVCRTPYVQGACVKDFCTALKF